MSFSKFLSTCTSITANFIDIFYRSYYGGLTLMISILKILKEILKDYIWIQHRIFSISTPEHHIPMRELKLLK